MRDGYERAGTIFEVGLVAQRAALSYYLSTVAYSNRKHLGNSGFWATELGIGFRF